MNFFQKMKRYRKGDKVVFKHGKSLQVATVDKCIDSHYVGFGLLEISFMKGDKLFQIMLYQHEVVLFEDFPEDVFWGSPYGKLLSSAF